jgi:glycine/D-amino acid oxidase-like deaminating enzyme
MNLSINDLSYWERKIFFDSIDYLVVGAGIVGISSAYHLKKKHPNAKILVIDKGILPFSASSKNAGFACFGSPSEILSDLRTSDSSKVWETVYKRWKGLNELSHWLGKENIDFQVNGSWDLIKGENQSEEIRDNLYFLNQELLQWTGVNSVYSEEKNDLTKFGFQKIHTLFKNKLEGQIDTSKLSITLNRKLAELDIPIIRGMELKSFETFSNKVEINTNLGIFSCANLIICTNGFTNSILPELNIEPARAQVLITKPIKNLKIKGTFHFDEGYFYFRNIDQRILIGGGRNQNFEQEKTQTLEIKEDIQLAIEKVLKTIVLPNLHFEVEHRWSGIMGVGKDKSPIIERISPRVSVAVRMGGMGIAIGTVVGQEIAELHS